MCKKFLPNALLFSLFLFLTTVSKSQQTLTQIGGWNAYVHLPANYAANTSISYPTIVFFPGIGEIGTNPAALISNGPGAYITQGWNGNVLVNSTTVEFIVISIQPPSAWPQESLINSKIQLIKSAYRVDNNRLYLTGLSMGGWCSTTFVTADAYGGPNTYASQIAAVVEVEGVIPDDNSPYPNLFDNFAASGGKLLGFEQANDNRGMPTRVNRMNATVANSAIYVQTNFGGGGHCCWNQFYGGQGTTPVNFMLNGVNQNMYQWLARQSRGVANILALDDNPAVAETIRRNKAVVLYPNPAGDYVNLKIPKEYADVYSISIADEYGNIMMKKSVTRGREAFTEVINIKDFQKGVYILQFFTKDQKLIRKLIKL